MSSGRSFDVTSAQGENNKKLSSSMFLYVINTNSFTLITVSAWTYVKKKEEPTDRVVAHVMTFDP